VSESYSISNSVGVSISIECPIDGFGQVYWEPLWSRYDGFWRPSGGDAVTVWIPTSKQSGRYIYECLG
jgi:hypothetical protein